MKKLFVILALAAMTGSVSAATLATLGNKTAIVAVKGDDKDKKKDKKKEKKSCCEGDKAKTCSKDGKKGNCCKDKKTNEKDPQ